MPTLIDHLLALQQLGGDGTQAFLFRRGAYLSGTPYLWSQFGERAYLFPSPVQAEETIRLFPVELRGAEVRQFRPSASP
jgi:hypothetical protein